MARHKHNAQGVCKGCGCSFSYYLAQSIKPHDYCSLACSNRYRKPTPIGICPVCGSTYQQISFGTKHKRKQTCSQACARQISFPKPRRKRKEEAPKITQSRKVLEWYESHDDYLRAFYPFMGSNWCAQKMGITPSRVQSRASKLGLRLTPDAKYAIVHMAAKRYMSGPGNPMKNPDVVQKVSDAIDRTGQRERIRKTLTEGKSRILRSNPSKVQYRLKELLESNNLFFEHEYVVKDKFIVDFAFPTRRVIVQVDGCYWHGHDCKVKALTERQAKQQKRDHAQDKYLTTCSWLVLRFWECEIYKNPRGVLRKIKQALDKSLYSIQQRQFP